MLDPLIPLLVSLGSALLFGWTAVHKWRSLREFSATVDEYRLLPAPAAPVVALMLALVETAVCVGLLWPEARALAATGGAALLLLYACAMAINLLRGRRDLDCGCGLVRRSIGMGMVVRNGVLAAGLALPTLDSTGRSLTLVDYVTVAAALVVGVLLYACVELLMARPALRTFGATENP